MGNYKENVEKPLSLITGELLGQSLLPAVKRDMLKQKVFQQLFGKDGRRIFTEELPSANDTIIPLIQFLWQSEQWQSRNTRVSGVIQGMIVLPADLMGKTDKFRKIAGAFSRWMESGHELFKEVKGLIEFGKNLSFRYDQAVKADATMYPIIQMTLSCLFDLQKFRLANPEIDLDAPLDAPEIPDISTYEITITDENLNVLIPTGILLVSNSKKDQ